MLSKFFLNPFSKLDRWLVWRYNPRTVSILLSVVFSPPLLINVLGPMPNCALSSVCVLSKGITCCKRQCKQIFIQLSVHAERFLNHAHDGAVQTLVLLCLSIRKESSFVLVCCMGTVPTLSVCSHLHVTQNFLPFGFLFVGEWPHCFNLTCCFSEHHSWLNV